MAPNDFDAEEFEEARPSREVLRRLSRYLRPYRRPFTIGVVLEIVFVAAGLAAPHLVKMGIERYIPRAELHGLLLIGGLYAASIVFQQVVAMVQIRLLWRSGQGAMNDIRKGVFRHVQALSMSYFDRTKQGRIIARADRDIDALEGLICWMPAFFLNSVLNLSGAVAIVTFFYDWRLSAALALVIPPMAVATMLFRRRGARAYRRIRQSTARITSHLAENITGVQVVQAYTREAENLQRFRTVNRDHHENVLRAARVWNMYWPVITLLSGAARLLVLAYGGYLAATGRLGPVTVAVGTLTATYMYLGRFFEPLMGLSEMYNEVLASSAAAERIFALLDTVPEVRDRPGAVPAGRITGAVEFDHVFFAYNGARRTEQGVSRPARRVFDAALQHTPPHAQDGWILEDVSLSASPGDSIALAGPTGAGKSTVVSLIARFYEPQRGAVRLDGCDIRQFTLESLHRQMGIVLQDNFLFTGTVMENIKYGRPEVDDATAIEAAKALGAHDFIERLAEGYQTPVKERGAGLSEGERQLICFTRALVADPRILILDEATSAVDAYTESILQRALRTLMRGRTTFVVAHRLSTIRHVTRVYFIDRGRVVQRGRHDELVRADGPYRRMYEQFIR